MIYLPSIDSDLVSPTMALGFLVVATLLNFFITKRDSKLPPYIPVGIFGRFEAMNKIKSNLCVAQLSRSVGSVFRLHDTMNREFVVVADALVAKAVLNDACSFKARKNYCRLDRRIGGVTVETLPTKEGPSWKNARSAVSPAFAATHVKRMKNACNQELQKWIHDTIDSRPGKAFDPFHEMTCLVLRVVCKEAFEYDVRDDEIDMFITENSKYLYESFIMQYKYPWRKWCSLLLPSVRRAYQASENIAVFAKHILMCYRKKVQQGVASGEDTFIKLLENSNAYKSEKEKIADIITMVSGSYHSTGHSIAWILYELAKHPHIVENYRNEIKDMADVHEWANTDCLRRIVREGLRLHTAFPVIAREVGRDIHTKTAGKNLRPRGFIIPKGMVVKIFIDAIHRNPEYHDNPDVFDPSRWINPSREAMDAFMPYALGRRNCMGQRLANAEIHMVVAKLAAEFNLEVVDDGRIFEGATVHRKGSRLIARKNIERIN